MMRQAIWDTVVRDMRIPQKTVVYDPHAKLLGVLMTILAGAGGLVESNTRIRPDQPLQRAIGLYPFPDQSTLSETVNACTAENVWAARQGIAKVYRQYGQGAKDVTREDWLVLDVDLTGMPCGRQCEEATKGYFSGSRGRRGRQLGRVVASNYDEIVVQEVYEGKKLLTQAFCPLVEAMEGVMGLDQAPDRRRHTLLRCDAGAGIEREINWALERGYALVTKLKHHGRTQKLLRTVTEWYPDPKVPTRYVGWVQAPHAFARPTLQVAVRSVRTVAGKARRTERILVAALTPQEVVSMTGGTVRHSLDPQQVALAVAYLYDQRGGGAETQNRNDKQGLGLTKRNKKSFTAQQMLVLLAELAHNLLIWARSWWCQITARWRSWGLLRIVRDIFHIPALVTLNAQGLPVRLSLSRMHPLSGPLIQPLQHLAQGELVVNLGEI